MNNHFLSTRGPPAQGSVSGPPDSVKRDMLQSKTVTFKPAYRGEDTLRPGDFTKHAVKAGQAHDDNRLVLASGDKL